MLKKLIIHEFRATSKTFLWLFAAFAVVALLNIFFGPFVNADKWFVMDGASSGGYVQVTEVATDGTAPSAGSITIDLDNGNAAGYDWWGERIAAETSYSSSPAVGAIVLQGILIFTYFLSILALLIITLIIIIQRFAKNILGREGYLSLTLPVRKEFHIAAKTIVGTVWILAGGVLLIASGLGIIARAGGWNSFCNLLELAADEFPASWLVVGIAYLIVGIITQILMFYAAMAWGQNLLKNRIGGSFLAFIILYVAQQLLGTVSLVVEIPRLGGLLAEQSSVGLSSGELASINELILVSLVRTIVCGAAYFLLTRYMLNKKLNLA